MNPRVSFLVPTHNRSDLLGLTLENVFRQTYEDFEVIVVDDSSDDDTPAVLESWAEREPRLTWTRLSPGVGASRARNDALRRARGPYIHYLDSDDYVHPDKLKRHLAILEGDSEAQMVVSQMAHFVEQPGDDPFLWNTFNSPTDLKMRFLQHDPVWGIHAPLWRRELLEQIGGLNESIPSAQDLDLHARALLTGAKVILDPTLLTYCRRHDGPSIGSDKRIRRYRVLDGIFDSWEPLLNNDEERRAVDGSRLFIASYAFYEKDVELADQILAKTRVSSSLKRRFGLIGRGLARFRRHRILLMMRQMAAKEGHDLEIRENWFRKHRIDAEPNLEIPAF